MDFEQVAEKCVYMRSVYMKNVNMFFGLNRISTD